MATSTSQALAKLRRKRKDSIEAYRGQVAASLNKYGKVVAKSFEQGLVDRAALVAKREQRENKQQSLRERFAQATSTVLSEGTLEFLREQSNIAAPTLTSIFAGYESARADRAARFERALDTREEGLKRVNSADELAFRASEQQRSDQLKVNQNILNTGVAARNTTFKAESAGIDSEVDAALTDQKIMADIEASNVAAERRTELEDQKARLQAEAKTVQNTRQLAIIDKEIEVAKQTAITKTASAESLAKIKHGFAVSLDGVRTTNDLKVAAQNAATSKAAADAKAIADRETDRLKSSGTLAEINARTAGSVKVKETVGGGTRDLSRPRASSSSSDGLDSTESFLRNRSSTITAEKSNDSVFNSTTPDSVTPAPEPEKIAPVVADDTERAGRGRSTDATVVLPSTQVEETPQGDAPVAPTQSTNFFDDVTAGAESSTLAATDSLNTLLTERDPNRVADLGELPTFDQLASLIDEDEEEDERLLQLVAGIRNNISTEVS